MSEHEHQRSSNAVLRRRGRSRAEGVEGKGVRSRRRVGTAGEGRAWVWEEGEE